VVVVGFEVTEVVGRAALLTNASLGLVFGDAIHFSTAFSGTEWTIGGSCTSIWRTALGVMASVQPSLRNAARAVAATSKRLLPSTSTLCVMPSAVSTVTRQRRRAGTTGG
jgi:hypothetical protein